MLRGLPVDGRYGKTAQSVSINSLSVFTVPCLVILFDNVVGFDVQVTVHRDKFL